MNKLSKRLLVPLENYNKPSKNYWQRWRATTTEPSAAFLHKKMTIVWCKVGLVMMSMNNMLCASYMVIHIGIKMLQVQTKQMQPRCKHHVF